MFVFLAASARAGGVAADFGFRTAIGSRLLCRIAHVENGARSGFGLRRGLEWGIVVHGCAFLCVGGLLRKEPGAVEFGHGGEQVGHAGGPFLFEFGRGDDFIDDEGGGAKADGG